MKSSFK